MAHRQQDLHEQAEPLTTATSLSWEPEPVDSDAYEYPVAIGNRVVNVAHSPGFGYVLVSLKDRGTDTTLVPQIAEQFNAALATGKYDSMFGQ